MRIYTQLIFDIGTMQLMAEKSYDYFGPVEWCKGDNTAKQAEQQQASFDASLMNIFQNQYATQKSQLDYLTAKMKPMIENPTGYSAQDLAAMRTGATDTNSEQFKNAQAALNNEISQASGGSKLVGVAGANVQADAALAAAAANQEATSQENITGQNEALKNSNYWNAINALNGTAAEQNPLGYAGAATSGSNAVSNLGQTVNAANQSQLLGALGGIAGGVGTALACPTGDALIVMSDGSVQFVKRLVVGDAIMGIDGAPQTIISLQSGRGDIVLVSAENGWQIRCSRSHGLMLSTGGFSAAAVSLGKEILTASGPSKVVGVQRTDSADVFNIVTDGNHTYCANGIWALGNVEGESVPYVDFRRPFFSSKAYSMETN